MVYNPNWHRHKYKAVKTEIDGKVFDSKHEADVYAKLKLREKAGEIQDLQLQPRFVLQDGFEKGGKKYRKIEYVADFQYREKGRIHVVDAKGYKTDVYKLKKKLFEKKYKDLTIEEV